MSTKVIVTSNIDEIAIIIKIPREDLFLLTDNQQQMLSLLDDKPTKEQIKIILDMMFLKETNNGR